MTFVTRKGSFGNAAVTTEYQWLTLSKDFEHKTLDSKWLLIEENIRLLKLSIACTFQCSMQQFRQALMDTDGVIWLLPTPVLT